ncbi:MAG: Gfo/Idh/MocA family oxidoreductase, partial [Psychrilyobacter sp.]|nr:Gfo/Idh/MocA family oxidoreductase [Psychrilyobacter sp.]
FGIIGTGRIAQQFLDEAVNNENIEVVGISARNFEKTKEIAKKYSIKRSYETSTEMLANSDIDAVYIATMHPTHYPYTMKSLEAGKHVLCEKPAVLKVSELEKVIKLAKEKRVLFMEAMIVGFNPIYQKIKKIIDDGELGSIVHIESSFGSRSTKIHKHNPKQAGGALYDIGIYNIFLLVDLLGEPTHMNLSMRANKWGVEGSVTGLFEYEGGITGSFYATMDSISGNSAKIIGTNGMVEIPEWSVAKEFTLKKLGEEDKIIKISGDRWLGYESESFVKSIIDGNLESKIMSHTKSMNLHRTIDRIKQKLGLKYEELEIEIR